MSEIADDFIYRLDSKEARKLLRALQQLNDGQQLAGPEAQAVADLVEALDFEVG